MKLFKVVAQLNQVVAMVEDSREWFETREELLERVAALKTSQKQKLVVKNVPVTKQTKKQQLKAAKGL